MTHHFRSYQFDPTDLEHVLSKLWDLLFNEYSFKGDVYYTHKWGKEHHITFIKYVEFKLTEKVEIEYILSKSLGKYSLKDSYTGWDIKESI